MTYIIMIIWNICFVENIIQCLFLIQVNKKNRINWNRDIDERKDAKPVGWTTERSKSYDTTVSRLNLESEISYFLQIGFVLNYHTTEKGQQQK